MGSQLVKIFQEYCMLVWRLIVSDPPLVHLNRYVVGSFGQHN